MGIQRRGLANMAYDSTQFVQQATIAAPERDFVRSERLGLLVGGAGVGALIGGFAAMALGQPTLWVMILTAAPVLTLALYLTARTLTDAMRRNARGCATVAGLHAAALIAWPLTSLFTAVNSLNFFIAPVLAMGSLVLFASCWSGSSRGVYRLAAQGALVALVAAHQGVIVLMAS